MRKQRKTYTQEKKVVINRKHLLDGVAMSDRCDERGVHAKVYYRCQKEFFEGGAAAFPTESGPQIGQLKQGLADGEEQVGRKNDVLAEAMEEYVRRKYDAGVR